MSSTTDHRISCGNCKRTHNTAHAVSQCYLTRKEVQQATVRQQNYAHMLARKRELPPAYAALTEESLRDSVNSMSFADISAFISGMAQQPLRAQPEAVSRAEGHVLVDGIYISEDLKDIRKAYWNLEHSRLLCKQLIVIREGFRVETSWAYLGTAASNLAGYKLLNKEDAIQYGQLYGICGRCGRLLNDEKSIAAGIGPVCAAKDW